MQITRREKWVVGLFLIVLTVSFIFPDLLDPDYEFMYLLLVVLPAGFLIATDPERRKITKNN